MPDRPRRQLKCECGLEGVALVGEKVLCFGHRKQVKQEGQRKLDERRSHWMPSLPHRRRRL